MQMARKGSIYIGHKYTDMTNWYIVRGCYVVQNIGDPLGLVFKVNNVLGAMHTMFT